MSYRLTHIRIKGPKQVSRPATEQPLSLWWVALAAAEETLQGRPLAPEWLRLFSNHLSTSEPKKLRWGGDLAESAELRRAYSALYGRFFARALLASQLGFTDFVPLKTKITTLPGGTTITRTKRGDIPDWVAWDPQTKNYVLCEAKGNLTGNENAFLKGKPACIEEGKKQFQRVKISNSAGKRIKTQNWVAANLWSTDLRPRESVSLLWDPPGRGIAIPESERDAHANGMRRRYLANIAYRLGLTGLSATSRDYAGQLLRISVKPSDRAESTTVRQEDVEAKKMLIGQEPPTHHQEISAATVVITPFGIRPIKDADDLVALHVMQRNMNQTREPAMVFCVSSSALQAAERSRELWLSENGIATPGGLGLFDLRKVEVSTP